MQVITIHQYALLRQGDWKGGISGMWWFNDSRSWQRAWDNWCWCVSCLHFSPPHRYSPWCQINSKMGIFILLKVYDFGSQQQSCGDWEICIYLLHKEGAFSECTQLSLVILHNGPEVIGSCAFLGTSIKSIKIPPLCHRNFGDAFEHWSNLTCVVFCDMIKKKNPECWWSIGGIKVSTKSA